MYFYKYANINRKSVVALKRLLTLTKHRKAPDDY